MLKKLLIVVSLLTCVSLQTFCQSEQLVINFARTLLPGQLTFENPKGSIKVTGYDGEVILVTSTLRFRDMEKNVNVGVKRIAQNTPDISAEVDGNNVTILCRTIGKTVDFDIKVPRDFSLKLRSLDNGIIEIVNIDGEIEVENINGDITLENVSGSAVLSSVYGKISAVFREVSPNSPMMFSSFEEDITITLPETINARIKMKSERGEIFSDFDIKPVKRQSVMTRVENTSIYSLEDWVVGIINKEGPEYVIKNYKGDIYLRKK